MDPRFQAIIEAAVEHARAEHNLLWADELAKRIVASTPLRVNAADIAEQLTHAAVQAGVAVTVARPGRCVVSRAAA
jgi:hypothetical protein